MEEFRAAKEGRFPEPADWEELKGLFEKIQEPLVPEGGSKLEADKYCKEMCRFSDSQLHNTGAFLGGVAAQEAVKLLIKQYSVLNNTLIYNGIHGAVQALQA